VRRASVRPVRAVAAVLAVAALLASPTTASAVPPPSDAATLGIPAGVSAALVEAATGQVLAVVDGERRRPIASAVKLVTGLVVVASIPPGTSVVVGPEVRDVGGASAGLRPGQTWDVDDLLTALLVRSGNDAAVALAVAAAGEEEVFVGRMESRLAELGIEADLASVTGLSDGDRLSALELATVARAVLAEPRLAGPAARPRMVLPDGAVLENRNRLIGALDGATGLKTGYTAAAGWTLVGTAERGGRVLIAVVIGAADDAARTAQVARLLEHGFSATVPVVAREELTLRTGRGPVRVIAVSPRLTVPVGVAPVLGWPSTLAPDAVPTRVPVRLDGLDVAEAEVTVADGRTGAAGRATLGAAAAEGVYAALRAAGAAGLLG